LGIFPGTDQFSCINLTPDAIVSLINVCNTCIIFGKRLSFLNLQLFLYSKLCSECSDVFIVFLSKSRKHGSILVIVYLIYL
jgi:hypothetical protein